MPKTIRIALAGGGTGGHTYPLLAVMQAVQKLFGKGPEDIAFHYFGAKDDFSADILTLASFHGITGGKIRRYSSISNLLDVPKFFIGFFEALFKLYWLMPDVLFSKGGTGALPVVVAAWWYRIPVLVHESDSVPGLTNLLSGRFARKVAVSFESAAPYFNPRKVMITGTPIRPEVLAQKMEPAAAKERLGFDGARPLVLVVGGSQGSERVNELILSNLTQILPLAQVYHQTGSRNILEVQKLATAALSDVPVDILKVSRYEAVAYLDAAKNGLALAAADIVIGRSGSGTIFEIAAFGKPAMLIPLPESARDHQRENAYAFASPGAAKVIEEDNLSPAIFLSTLRLLLENQEVRQKMGQAATDFYRPEADRVLAEELMRLAK